MPSVLRLLDRLRAFSESPRALLGATLLFLALSIVLLFLALHTERHTVRISAGDAWGRRAEVARALASVAARHGLDLEITPTAGSEETLELLERGALDVALVQGGLPAGPHVCEVAPLVLEPLHLLVRRDRDIVDLEDLEGARIQLSPPRSGTRRLALQILALAHYEPGSHFEEVSYSYRDLEELAPDALPDAIFHVSALPSPLARFLIEERGYRLLPLPIADAVALRNIAVSRGVIPASTYGAAPPTPPQDVPTLATRMLLVAHRDTSEDVVRRMLEVIDSEEFASAAMVPQAMQPALFAQTEFPLHPGTVAWLRRNDPLLTPDLLEGIESVRSFLVSLVVAGVFAFRWWRRKKLHGLDKYIAEASQIERKALELERDSRLDLERLFELRSKLGETKTQALEAFQRGEVHSEELLGTFLVHVADVRSHLSAMILHERERLEKTARARGGDEEKVLRALWEEALAEEHEDRAPRERRPG